MAGDYWNPLYWQQGNFYPENGAGVESMALTKTTPLFDTGGARDTNNSFPGFVERGVGVDSLSTASYNTPTISNATNYDDDSLNHLEVHFSTNAVRDAYTAALASASTPAAVAAVVQNYRDHAVGGFWGTLGVAP